MIGRLSPQTYDMSTLKVPRFKNEKLGLTIGDATPIIALDPGGTTGWSLFILPKTITRDNVEIPVLQSLNFHSILELSQANQFAHGQVDCGAKCGNLYTGHHKGISTEGEAIGVYKLMKLIDTWPDAVIVIEDFVLRTLQKQKDLLSPVRITAALSYELWRRNRCYFAQNVSDAKSIFTDDRLKTFEVYTEKGAMRHARDADRHLLLFIRRCMGNSVSARRLRHSAWEHIFNEEGEIK